ALLGDLAELRGQALDQRVEAAHDAGDGAGDDTGELADQDFAAGQQGDRLEAGLVERGRAHEAALVGEDIVLFVEGRDRFRGRGGVATDEGESGRALQQLGQA